MVNVNGNILALNLLMMVFACLNPALSLAEADCQPEYKRGYEQAVVDLGALAYDPESVKKARERGERIVFIVGDSIAHGSYLKGYTDVYPELANVSRPDRVLNLIAKENNIKIYFQSMAANPFQLYWFIRRGGMIGEDTIITQDSGNHPNDLEIYRSILLLYRYFVHIGNPEVKLFFSTTYDKNPTIPNAQWDVAVDNGVSMNMLIAETAKQNHKYLPGASVIPTASVFNKAASMLAPHQVDLIFGDGIHLTLIGNIVFAKAVMEGLGLSTLNYSELLDMLSRMKFSHKGSDMSNIIRRPRRNIDKDEMDKILKIIMGLSCRGKECL